MNDIIFDSIKKFFQKNGDGPLLFGYSGGYDSKALLYLLHQYKETYGLDLHVAHVDHKWRESSTLEARELQEESETLNLRFYLKTLSMDDVKGNLEAYCREQRLSFFSYLFKKHSFKALILAHHMDDLSETVLKRVLEGACLSNLRGMEKKSILNDMLIFRPLLDFKKKELIEWLDRKKLVAIDDATNRDTKYLRSRMRQLIIPALSQSFGKEVSNNLALASKQSIEISQYLEKRTQRYFDLLIDGPFGQFIDLTNCYEEIEPIEMKHFIRRVGRYSSIDLSKNVIDRISYFLLNNRMMSLNLKEATIIIQNSCFFALKNNDLSSHDERVKLHEGKNSFGRWDIDVHKEEKERVSTYPNWKNVLGGKFEVMLPLSEYFLDMPTGSLSYCNKRLSKWFSENRVPIFMRFSFPVIFKDDKMYYEFLSGKKRFKEPTSTDGHLGRYYRLSFNLRD